MERQEFEAVMDALEAEDDEAMHQADEAENDTKRMHYFVGKATAFERARDVLEEHVEVESTAPENSGFSGEWVTIEDMDEHRAEGR